MVHVLRSCDLSTKDDKYIHSIQITSHALPLYKRPKAVCPLLLLHVLRSCDLSTKDDKYIHSIQITSHALPLYKRPKAVCPLLLLHVLRSCDLSTKDDKYIHSIQITSHALPLYKRPKAVCPLFRCSTADMRLRVSYIANCHISHLKDYWWLSAHCFSICRNFSRLLSSFFDWRRSSTVGLRVSLSVTLLRPCSLSSMT